MESLTFVVYGMNGKFWDEILYSAWDANISVSDAETWRDYIAMMCGL